MEPIIPEPVQMQPTQGHFKLNSSVEIMINSSFSDVAKYLQRKLGELAAVDLQIRTVSDGGTDTLQESVQPAIILTQLDNGKIPHNEGYRLHIADRLITLEAKTPHGAFNGVQTLLQLALKNSDRLPCLEILDYPRFEWRGYMLDEGRYFLGKDAVKKILDWLALLKINKFHWHLTEDQGWRIEIKKYPKLTEVGSKRRGTPKYRNINVKLDGIPHEGYYSQKDVKEIVDYAAERFIDVIPEIEFPGHSTAALAAYPELSCDGQPRDVESFWGVKHGIYCLGKPEVMDFVKDVFAEVCGLFPFEFVHIGGDEVPKRNWQSCDACQRTMKNLGLKDEHAYQVHFTNVLSEFMRSQGKRIIFWNEVTDEKTDKSAVCQYWHGTVESIVPFLESGGNAIISPSSHYYLDVAYHDTPLKQVYEYEPIPADFSAEAGESVFGVEAEMWGEVFKSLGKVEWCSFPRLLAVAETAWSPRTKKDYKNFVRKVEDYEAVLDRLGINYASGSETDMSGLKRFLRRLKKGFTHYA